MDAGQVRSMTLLAAARGWLDAAAIWDAACRFMESSSKGKPQDILGALLDPARVEALACAIASEGEAAASGSGASGGRLSSRSAIEALSRDEDPSHSIFPTQAKTHPSR